MRGAFLEDLTWPEAGARIAAGAVVVLPVGAAAKEHGPHLPLRTDYLVARELGRRVAEALPVLVRPSSRSATTPRSCTTRGASTSAPRRSWRS
jgi:creatinine amidohydrolase